MSFLDAFLLTFRFLRPEELMACHGFKGYQMLGLTKQEQMCLIGRGMSATTLAVVMVPIAKALGYCRPLAD